jgi:fatty acid-binding protein DegV
MMVLRAHELLMAGQGLAEVLKELERIRADHFVRFTVATLEFLKRGGRIGGAQAFLGTLLNIKPILTLKGGRVETAGRARGERKAREEIVKDFRAWATGRGKVRAFFLYSGEEEAVRELKAMILGLGLRMEEALVSELGAVIASHTGPAPMGYMPTASKTAFVADTTLGLSPEQALEKGIHLVPVQVIHGGRSYRDLLEVGPKEILALLEKGERLSTSQAAPEDLRTTYERLLLDHDRVLSVHLSGKLSGTVATAQAVARAYGGRVQVLDSWSLNGGLWLVLEEARRLLKEGVAWERLGGGGGRLPKKGFGLRPPQDPHLPPPLGADRGDRPLRGGALAHPPRPPGAGRAGGGRT